jgi:crotonobetainyl-CoA:carnitine CoA-transferase CaiB-like acyl-CoA transferase
VAAVLDGVKVVEVAGWTFVPAGGGVLADWGADVIKIEHPETGDPQRGLLLGWDAIVALKLNSTVN